MLMPLLRFSFRSPAGLGPGRGFRGFTRKRLEEGAEMDGQINSHRSSAKQFCWQGASSQAFQLLTIGKETGVVKRAFVKILAYLTHKLCGEHLNERPALSPPRKQMEQSHQSGRNGQQPRQAGR